MIGGWAVRPDGSVATEIVTDRGDEARRTVEEAVAMLASRLAGAVVVPSFRTPMERRLSKSL